ncbi:Hypothetical predicted protein [Mytilus galloprovincialis]|uniref:Beta-galactosidase n=1 Tax=Mytilus galloprovincialis TaxID=29158 RepID=A0A8B6EU15_MYTGA|nr:Hypothetical predicted protein [Mytilus galloprovincialis]
MSEVYCSTGSLTFRDRQFYLDGKPFTILSGAIHYFRVVPEYWKDRLMKIKACGLNTVETYVCWNLHEKYPNEFDFSGILDVRKFIRLAEEVGLYVIFRPGPYICAEWDFGGMPAWLLRDPEMKVRSNYKPYQDAVDRFFSQLIPLVSDLQNCLKLPEKSSGGPIIAFQVENEFGSYSKEYEHLKFIHETLVKYGAKELFLTSENPNGITNCPFYDRALPTANFPSMKVGAETFDLIRKWSPSFPLMVTEFWSGWFDHWTSTHKGLPLDDFAQTLTDILDAGSSVNMYMFHGGTNFGFMSGANRFPESTYKPDVSSYDYDAPLSEAGDVTAKYLKARDIIFEKILKPQGINSLPTIPPNTQKASYDSIEILEYLSLDSILTYCNEKVESSKPINMENLQIHNGFGQNYGYILYRTKIGKGRTLRFEKQPTDRAQIFIDGIQNGVLDWREASVEQEVNTDKEINTLDILVENHGRVNYIEIGESLLNEQRKGITGNVFLDDNLISNWTIVPMEFEGDFVQSVLHGNNWTSSFGKDIPVLCKTILTLTDTPKDTFLLLSEWGKGIVFINGFNLGRYWSEGPQRTLYVPAPILKTGDNQILIFEHQQIGKKVAFVKEPILK